MNTTSILKDLVSDRIVQLNPSQPFTFASGIKSPIYTDLRLTISYPKLRRKIYLALGDLIETNFPNATVIGGVATAGIPHAAWVAEEMQLPMIYVRSKPKDHGTSKQIEGRVTPSDHIVLIDDLISTGGSVIKASKAVQADGYQVDGVVSIFSYGFADATDNFKKANLKFVPLLTYPELIKQMLNDEQIQNDEYERLNKWHQDPWSWK
ncbi:orotate phosphoribosyltransferase [Fructilactobacillus fructivorans]|uniref:Orotate phosphoribosyltransferase n=1 Tax=Fructilactobacillus fructivorans TaxID=1614 RepID=A0AAE6TZ10_9LACO|nr:orotate phosphoribosyltransferase [Fructilactobacillus fructivorans]QFX93300.1 orotate phosphoribosyltransferase [Fructilactobacillus fructivorans]RDV65308.1 orotate phosphoribosyltransferase [Fructilactobacillus fructivorans]